MITQTNQSLSKICICIIYYWRIAVACILLLFLHRENIDVTSNGQTVVRFHSSFYRLYTASYIQQYDVHVDRNGNKKRIAIKEKEKYRDEIDIAMKCMDIWLFSSSQYLNGKLYTMLQTNNKCGGPFRDQKAKRHKTNLITSIAIYYFIILINKRRYTVRASYIQTIILVD